jgi:hypothetical protein
MVYGVGEVEGGVVAGMGEGGWRGRCDDLSER